jgi:hypothetical protein
MIRISIVERLLFVSVVSASVGATACRAQIADVADGGSREENRASAPQGGNVSSSSGRYEPAPEAGTSDAGSIGARAPVTFLPIEEDASADAVSTSTAAPTYAQGETIVTLATGQSDPYCVTVDATNVYWAANGDNTVMKVPIGGGMATILAVSPFATGIATDGTSVYWSGGLGAYKVSVNGGMPVLLSSGFTNDNIVLGPTGLFGTDGDDALVGVPIAGGMTTRYTGGSGQNTYGLAADSTSVYWSNFDGTAPILKTSLDGSASITLATGHVVFGMAVDATYVYWAEASSGNIMKVPLGGGDPSTVASGLVGISQLAMDEANLYVTAGSTTSTGLVARVDKDTGFVTYLAVGQNQAWGIAVDATSVYWTTLGNEAPQSGTVMKATPK